MSTTLAQAEQLRDRLTADLDELVDLVTLDGVGIKPQTRAAVIVQPPELTFITFTERDTAFSLVAVAGPADKPVHAWAAIDKIIDRLEDEGYNLATARPATFGLAGSGSLPAYEITLNPL